MSLSDLCACGHDRESHYKGTGFCFAYRCVCLHHRRPVAVAQPIAGGAWAKTLSNSTKSPAQVLPLHAGKVRPTVPAHRGGEKPLSPDSGSGAPTNALFGGGVSHHDTPMSRTSEATP
jgi:hypothetical protein